MTIEQKLVRVEDPADPLRCQGPSQTMGQCPYLSMKGLVASGHITDVDESLFEHVDRCPRHGGVRQLQAIEKKRLHQYRLQVWQERVDEFAEGEEVKSLRGEIGITRMMIEEILNQCKDPQMLMLYSTKIQYLIQNCEKLVRTCERIEKSSSLMMDRSAALSFASRVVEIIGQHIDDPEIIDSISNGIIDTLKDA